MFKPAGLETHRVPVKQGIPLGRFVANCGTAYLETSIRLERFFQYLLQSRIKILSNNVLTVCEAQPCKRENITKLKGSKFCRLNSVVGTVLE